ncbi:MAG: TM0106 family RecB-like putative nuclease, partial [Planctomycetota bacterium]
DSSFATWMDRYNLERPGELEPDETPADLQLLFDQGNVFERSFVKQLEEEGRDLFDAGEVKGDRIEATRQALLERREIIYQGELRKEPFAGYPDFLVRVDGESGLGDFHYEVWDTKLSRHPKPSHLIQLAAYADMLTEIQGRRPEFVRVVLGTGERKSFRTEDCFYYYREVRRAFLAFMEEFDPRCPPLPDPTLDHFHWQSHAERYVVEQDHLVQVAGIARSQIRKLEEAGIRSMTALAETEETAIAKLSAPIFERLRAQARLQVRSKDLQVPLYEVLPRTEEPPLHGFEMLPPVSAGDFYFDMEGYPFHGEHGLEYLFGASFLEGGKPRFRAFWGHDSEAEKRAFCQFVDWAMERWRDDQAMHIYHYAAYETQALKRLAQDHMTREREVDQLLRRGRFVDLYTVAKLSVRVGEPRYSLKNLEHLYRGRREGDVTTAMDSVVWYANWIESGEGRSPEASERLRKIEAYNKVDCDSTLELAAWLRARQKESGIAYVRANEPPEEDEEPDEEQPDALRQEVFDRLTQQAGADSEDIATLLSQLIGFHRREDKPKWWAAFERTQKTAGELMEDFHCIGGLERADGERLRIRRSVGCWYRFPPDQDTRIGPDSKVRFVHDPFLQPSIEEFDAQRGRILLLVGQKRAEEHENPFPTHTGLMLDEIVRADALAEAVLEVARGFAGGRPLTPALATYLRRDPPRIEGQAGGPLIQQDEQPGDALPRLVPLMRDTTLCVQGPPGSGKTTSASAAILKLLDAGKIVGITSNSHAAIENLMEACAARRDWRLPCIKAEPKRTAALLGRCKGAVSATNSVAFDKLGPDLPLIGGTAWLFARPEMVSRLDYLFVDEAGQVSLANLVGMSRAAANLVLIGDQMQLSQPTQACHPGDSGLSSLDYMLREHAVVPDDRGLFLRLSYRMHPALCGFISSAVYEGRLDSAKKRENRVVLADRQAGIRFVPVHHQGNTQCSTEEVDEVARIIDELLATEHTDLDGKNLGKLRPQDILVVAPYNMQVRLLEERLKEGVAVGTVDRFQGQQGKVVIISMCASDGSESPRGIDFLFQKNRLNVALSRAQSLAIVVGHPGLARTSCSRVEQIELVNLYCRILQEGQE